MAQVRVDGLNRLIRDFKRAGGDAEYLKDAWVPIGEKVKKEAERAVPVRSGKLKSTIRLSRAQRSVTIRAGNAKAFYAPWVSFGSVHNKTPKPFLREALSRVDVTREVEAAVNSLLRKSGL